MIDQIKAAQVAIDNALKASGHELTPRQLKANQISKVLCQFAGVMAKNCIKISVQKKIFPRIDRRPSKRMLRNQIKVQMALAYRMTQMQVQQIISQPTPKFPPGGCYNTGIAIVGETGMETFKGIEIQFGL